MSTLSVAKKDFKAARRSWSLWSAAILLGIIAAFVAYTMQGFNEASLAVTQRAFQTLTQVLSILLPIVALVASYLAIAGEREGGGIKFLLSLPNTRRHVFVGKFASRLGILVGAIGFMYLAAVAVTLTRHGVLPAGVVLGTLGVTLLYGAAFVSVAVSMSAATAARSRAIAGAFGSYFVLVVMYIFPLIQIPAIVRWVHTTIIGADANPDLYNAVSYTSPWMAYRKATNLVVPDGLNQRPFRSSIDTGEGYGLTDAARADPDLPVYLSDEFSLVVLAFWLVVPLVVGYWLFERSDLE